MKAETIEINGLRITSKLQEILQYIGEDTDTYLDLIFHLEDILLTMANDDLNTAFDCVEKLIYLSYFRNLVLALRVKGEE